MMSVSNMQSVNSHHVFFFIIYVLCLFREHWDSCWTLFLYSHHPPETCSYSLFISAPFYTSYFKCLARSSPWLLLNAQEGSIVINPLEISVTGTARQLTRVGWTSKLTGKMPAVNLHVSHDASQSTAKVAICLCLCRCCWYFQCWGATHWLVPRWCSGHWTVDTMRPSLASSNGGNRQDRPVDPLCLCFRVTFRMCMHTIKAVNVLWTVLFSILEL